MKTYPRNSRPGMVLDAPDYQVPPTTQKAKGRAASLRAARGGGDGYCVGPFRGPEGFTPYVRCITRGVPGSMMPAIYGNSYDMTRAPGYVTIRYEMVHETRDPQSQVLEYACHEGNEGMRNMLNVAREPEKLKSR